MQFAAMGGVDAGGDGAGDGRVQVDDLRGGGRGGVVFHDHGVEFARVEEVVVHAVEVFVGVVVDIGAAGGFHRDVDGEGAGGDGGGGCARGLQGERRGADGQVGDVEGRGHLDGFVEAGEEVEPHLLGDGAGLEGGSVGADKAAGVAFWAALGEDDGS